MIAWVGDSITAGEAYPGHTPPAELSRLAGVAVGNFGQPGQESRLMINRWRNYVRSCGFSTLVLLAGVNDILQNPLVTADDIFGWLKTMYVDALADGMRVIPVTLTPWGGTAACTPERQAKTEGINALIRSFAASAQLKVADAYVSLAQPGEPTVLRREWSQDGLHPNADGCYALAKTVFGALR